MKPLAGDWLIIGLMLVLIGLSYRYFWSFSTAPAQFAEIRSPYETLHVALQPDRTLSIKGKLGVSKLVIEHGKIRFIASPCALKYCIHSGWLHHEGDFSACVPNAVSVTLTGIEQAYDAINY